MAEHMTEIAQGVAEFKTLSVIVPCFNEAATVAVMLRRILAADTLGLDLEIIVVNDGSTDGSQAAIEQAARSDARIKSLSHGRNRGKGAAVRTAIKASAGEFILIQDADLEYDPSAYSRLLRPVVDGLADVVYGSRFRSSEAARVLYFWHSVANSALTLLSNMCTNLNLTDVETGYTLFRREILDRIDLKEERFGFEAEVTARIARLRPLPNIYEIGIGYRGRTYAEGKKIGLRDALRAAYCIIRYSLLAG